MKLTKIKKCKVCLKTFTVYYSTVGSGNKSALQRNYCSCACKVLYNKEHKSKTNIKKICPICNKVYYRAVSLSTQKTCSVKCRSELTRRETRREHEERMFEIECEYKKCNNKIKKYKNIDGQCNNTQRFCSHECFSKNQNKRIEITCIYCGNVFIGGKDRKVCNRRCQFAAQSAGLIKVNTNGRTGYRADINNNDYFKSSFEADFARYISYIGKTYTYEPKTILVKHGSYERFYTPDFYIHDDNAYYELKGIKNINNDFSKMMNENLVAVNIINNNTKKDIDKIKILYMKDFYQYLKDINLFDLIENLEHRDYNGTKHLIRKK